MLVRHFVHLLILFFFQKWKRTGNIVNYSLWIKFFLILLKKNHHEKKAFFSN